ncbi:hypothetical protein GTO89_09290 [Heliobacterium gestii]|uniref:Uncharacterized protein n=1 Tax=Heliomicrobium gestii TaxID=2699 RepID=A0A845LCD7_HELGE|nr:hypothetical protein [Heliomicrobium gestii]MBM7866488.1 hypothetical protein [Heliomicrobium gestii]MZP43231.1 hypothetical protein [Heliomicrobium gestii]
MDWQHKMNRRAFLAAGATGAAGLAALALWKSRSDGGLFSSRRPSFPWTLRSVEGAEDIVLRRHPYPYRASLSITSDIDGTSPKEFNRIHQFLNSDLPTETGQALSLDIADSCWMVVDTNWEGTIDRFGNNLRDQMSYWRDMNLRDEYAADWITKYVRCGWIDSVHSYGDFNRQNGSETTFHRRVAAESIAKWYSLGFQFTVWINHGNSSNVQNLSDGRKRTYEGGDDPSSPYYHTDLLIPYGIRFVWHSASSSQEYLFGYPDLLYPITLGDGQRVWGFHRFSCARHFLRATPDYLWSPYNLDRQLTEESLRRLIDEGGFSAVAQHLGGPADLYNAFPDETLPPLRRIAQLHHEGTILVARTSRLLRYNQINNFLRFSVHKDSEGASIVIEGVDDPHLGAFKPVLDDVRGITFYCTDPAKTKLFLGERQFPDYLLSRNPADHTGRPSLSVRWFQPDTLDYSQWG